jgi:hypothetical protein
MIEFCVHQNKLGIPNAWEELTPGLFEGIMTDMNLVTKGKLSPGMLQVKHVCRAMGWDPRRLVQFKDEETLSNLAWLGEQVDFVFRVSYPDQDAALQELSREDYIKAKRTPPERLDLPIARYLSKLDYKFVLNSCFCAQLIPYVSIQGQLYSGYTIDTSFNQLTCSLTALQFIEARSLLGCDKNTLPLLAAILYHPGVYNSESAHTLAKSFERLSDDTLQSIAFNFSSFINYLFSATQFRILVAGENEKKSPITTGAVESLYNLSGDGLGDISTIEQMNIIKYLTVLRKKLIEAIQSMSFTEMPLVDIAKNTGLPISLIKQII